MSGGGRVFALEAELSQGSKRLKRMSKDRSSKGFELPQTSLGIVVRIAGWRGARVTGVKVGELQGAMRRHIIVEKVEKDSAAWVNGKIKVGDKIIAILSAEMKSPIHIREDMEVAHVQQVSANVVNLLSPRCFRCLTRARPSLKVRPP
eukprot:764732-Hanusia_phi.AAC.1